MVKVSRKGGFLRGVAYGLFLSLTTFVALVYLFPMALGAPEPDLVEIVRADPQGTGFSLGDSDGAGVVIGGSGDSTSMPGMQAPLPTDQSFQAPAVESQSAARPNIGADNESGLTGDGSSEATAAPVVVTEGVDNSAANNEPPAGLQPLATGSAIEIFSANYEIVQGKSLVAIILEDTQDEFLQVLLDTGVAFSFAIPANTSVQNAGQSFRELGYEVLAMIPDDASQSGNYVDLFNSYIENVPVSVALIDNSLVSILRDEDASNALFEVVAQSGHGAISFAGAGDQRARGLARSSGVPFGTVTRIVDTDPDPVSIRKALDQALLAALTGGSAIVYARTNEVTVDVLTNWLASDRMELIQIAPASVVLSR